jgi:hypothetical protein
VNIQQENFMEPAEQTKDGLEQAVDLLLWVSEDGYVHPGGGAGCAGSAEGTDSPRVLEIGPEGDGGVIFHLVTHRYVRDEEERRANDGGGRMIDEAASTSFILNAQQIEELREYFTGWHLRR